MATTLFTRIIEGEIPCHKVYEDPQVFAFLDIGPLAPGHTLVIPKHPVERLEDLSEDSAAALGRALPRIARAVLAASGAADYHVIQKNGASAGQVVPHVHFHIIPKFTDQGLGVTWKPGELSSDDGRTMAAKIVERLA
ncbi:MAG: HIT family protein [Myxococcales bacterium]|nr:HIT family protein [Myxococcales bacterium]